MTNIIIVGGDERGKALIELFHKSDLVNIVAVIDINTNAPGMKLARELNIPASTDVKEFINSGLDEIIDVTGNKLVEENLRKITPLNTTVVSGRSVELIWHLFEKIKDAEKKIKEAKDELDIQSWGLNKTNEAIKLLYKELEEKTKRLQELDKLKSNFISAVSHELRTPLTVTKEGICLVLDGIPGEINEKQKEILAVARDNVDRLTRMINNLLDISKIEAGKIELKRELVDVISLAKQIVSSLELKTKEKGLELKTAFAERRIDAYIDIDRIVQVFTNLIWNAIKFTKDGYVEVSVRDKDDEVECVVADTGIGISKENLPQVFSKFQQFSRAEGPGEKGTGLGLSITKEIVEMHKGRIWVDSEFGKGTQFTFTLPKYTPEALFNEYVHNGIREAMKKGLKMSLIVVSVAEFDKVKKMLPAENIQSILQDMRDILDDGLRQTGDIVIKDTGEIIVLLVGCGKEGASRVEKRLRQSLLDYLTRNNLAEKIKLHFGCATYPDEAKDNEELIKKAKKNF